ncbi:MAG: UvrD-helicase domain-containing protein [Parachlamydiales bacterium]|jgi:DNA helicase-2/ATP-dependent DNA helicase PcrA
MPNNWKLNPEQEKAVLTTKGRILVLAGAGSGKTRVITYRIAHLIQNCRVEPHEILGLTFTNKAAGEMRSRLKELINPALAKKAHLATFHSFCLEILRKEAAQVGYRPHFTIYDDADKERLLKNLLKEHWQISIKQMPPIAPLAASLSAIKNRGLKNALAPLKNHEKEFLSKLFENFNTALRAYNAVDFDSLLTLTDELFEKKPEILKKYQNQYRYVMIDEYQDTSPIQYRIAEKLSALHNNLCVVGDDDQSIYAFRGAEIEHIINFKADMVVKLEQNYRSSKIILQAANSVIQHNLGRHKKNLWSTKEHKAKIVLFHAPGDKEEAEAVANKIVLLKKQHGLAFKEIAVLYRSNALSRQMEIALMNVPWEEKGCWKRGIPYEIFGGVEFSQRSEIKDVMAYLRLIVNPDDLEALLRIINVPRRGISEKTLEYLNSLAQSRKSSLWQALLATAETEDSKLPGKTLKGLRAFVQIIEEAKKRFQTQRPLFETLKWFLEAVNYRQAILEETKSEKGETFKWENVEESLSALAQYEESEKDSLASEEAFKDAPRTAGASLADFIATTALAKQNPFQNENLSKQDKLQLMTFHSAKGLEFKACFLIGLEDHILPHEKSQISAFSIEEERRLFYVALTRAMDFLFLSMAQNRRKGGGLIATRPSRFLKEIPRELLEISSYKT